MAPLDPGNTWVQIIFTSMSVGLVTVFVVLRLYAYLTCGVCKTKNRMDGKTVLITGANSGIGKETARELAKRGARVIMACRNMKTAREAQEEIIKETGNENVIVKNLDLGSQQSVREFAADIIKSEDKLDVLIHNAGMALAFSKAKSEDGIELTMATNHYNPFLLTHLLIDLLKKPAHARIVIVASELYRLASVNIRNLNPINTFPPAYIYYVSKYCNIYFGRELAMRLQSENSNITVNMLHPGMIDSGIWRNVPFPLNYGMMLLTKGFFKTPEQGAQTTIYLATADELRETTGKYFMDCKERALSEEAMNMETAQLLWEKSAVMCHLKKTDPQIVFKGSRVGTYS